MGAAGLICIALSQNVSVMGKTWWMSMVVSRVLLVLLAGFTLYSDDQGRFVCNTIQPGCSNVCFDAFAPVSVYHLWLFHCILLGLPHVLFATYVAHKVLSHAGSASGVALQTSGLSLRGRGAPRFHCTYSLTVVLRIALEVFFGAGQFFVFGLSVPKSFFCYEAPCVSGVECYVSKPTEKTLMLHFMLGVSSLSILISLLDLLSSMKASGRWRSKEAMLVEEMSKEERSSVFTTTGSGEDGGVSTRRTRPSRSSTDADLPDPKVSASVIPMDESACSPAGATTPSPAPLRGAPSNPRGPAPKADTNVGLHDPVAANPGQQCETQDKRAWV